MSVQAVITEPKNGSNQSESMFIAGYTSFRFSGWFSSAAGEEIKRYEWDPGDGSGIIVGPVASWIYANPGTYTPTLTVYGTDRVRNNKSTVSWPPITVTAFAGTDIYADAVSGNDSTGTGAIGAPYQTLLKCFQAGFLIASQNNPVRINLKKGQTFPYTFTGGDDGCFIRPMIGDTWSSGADPIVSVNAGSDMDRDDNHIADQWGRSIMINHWQFAWAANSAHVIHIGTHGSYLRNCKVTNGKVGLSGALKLSAWSTEVTGYQDNPGTGGAGIGSSGSCDFNGVISCNSHGNGNDAVLQHQGYLHGNHIEVRGSTFDGAGAAAADDGLKISGGKYMCIVNNIFQNNTQGTDIGSNGSLQGDGIGQFAWIQFNLFKANGYNTSDWLVDAVIANNYFTGHTNAGGNPTFALRSVPATPSEVSTRVRIYNNTFYNSTSADFGFGTSTGQPTQIEFKNNICMRTASAANKPYINLTQSPSGCIVDGNLYYASGDDANTAGTFNDGSARTFNQWLSISLHDTNAVYGFDPLLNNVGADDLSIKKGSPAQNNGLALLIVDNDYTGTHTRPQGPAYDIGANERLVLSVAGIYSECTAN